MRAVTRAPYVSTDRKTCRHCEPPFQKWQELVNHDKGARQSDFDILSGVDGKRKNADCRAVLPNKIYLQLSRQNGKTARNDQTPAPIMQFSHPPAPL